MREIILRILLSPITLIYGIAISIRNLLYKQNILRPVHFDLPVISVGNLSMGGTGKSPHIEFLVSWLKNYLQVAILSRGYKRETTGFQIGQEQPSVKIIGDEPFQFLQKFPDVPIAVAEQREIGIPLMLKAFPSIQLMLLDDAFQHLSVKPYINILLTSYDEPFTRDFLLPSGRLREWRSSYKRADIIIVTKCPSDLDVTTANKLKQEIRLKLHQSLFFSHYAYQKPYFIFDRNIRFGWRPDFYCLLVSGIANTEYLQAHINPYVKHLQMVSFTDHHWYSNYDLGQIKRQYDQLPGNNKIIITTEKDATRLALHRSYILENKLPIFVLPVEVSFLWNEENQFKDIIAQKLLEFKS